VQGERATFEAGIRKWRPVRVSNGGRKEGRIRALNRIFKAENKRGVKKTNQRKFKNQKRVPLSVEMGEEAGGNKEMGGLEMGQRT